MSKYAVVVPCSKGYLYGLNAIINGLDLYKNTADVVVLWYENNVKPDMEAVAAKFFAEVNSIGFPFKIKVINVEDVFGTDFYHKKGGWMCRYARWKITKSLGEDYNALCHLGADVMVLENIMPWFDLVADTDVVITGRNALGSYNFHSDEIIHTNNAPIADLPCFVDPRKHGDTMYRVYDIGASFAKEGKGIGDMPAFYFALKEHNAKTVLLPDGLWIRNYRQADKIVKMVGSDGLPFIYSTMLRQKVTMIHGKWWSRKHIDKNIMLTRGKDIGSLIKNNLEVCYDIMRYYNTKCRLKLNWITDI